jgi:hypothetical protein
MEVIQKNDSVPAGLRSPTAGAKRAAGSSRPGRERRPPEQLRPQDRAGRGC